MIQFFGFLLLEKGGKKVTVGYVTIMNGDLFPDIFREKIDCSLRHGTVPSEDAMDLISL